MKTYKTKNAKETRLLAKELASSFAAQRNKKKRIIALTGELGSGKTTFVKSFTRAVGVNKKITSPTFLIIRRFPIKNKQFKNIFHIDAYRIKGNDEAISESIKNALLDKSGLVLVEWAENIKRALPKDTIWVKFKYGKERNERKITIN